MARPGGLGKGLGALIPVDVMSTTGEEGDTYRELAIDAVVVNQYQPRQHFDEEALDTLTASVAEFGVLQPIVVRPSVETGRFELIAGERRWRASRKAGLTTIPAIVRTADDQTSLVQAVVENIHRQDLNALEEAAAYQQLLEDFGVTHEELAERLGKGRTTITNTLRLLQLPVAVQRPLVEGQISAGHARALLSCPDRAIQEELTERIIDEGWSVRAVEDAVREAVKAKDESAPRPAEPATPRPAALLELEQLLAERLSTNVKVQMGAKKGRISIDFATLSDLERIYHVIQSPESR
ncbi:MAG: ParB/RepB/Spo0J family partition protein [Actinomycetota bacterium]|jgi:ParB family transcriptional regulator, chromosome partitioning protein|nr:ParB/RepB/Spo0J family partition protein [Actinomycetota bacterium]